MKSRHVLIFSIFLLWSFSINAKTSAADAAANSLAAVTVFLDVNKFNRKNLAAKKMTKSHNEFAAFDYELVAVNPYIENGDLEGFFVSYKKK